MSLTGIAQQDHIIGGERMPIGSTQLAKISWLEPSKILRDEKDRVGLFFLALSIVSNDLKDICELMIATQEELTTAEGVVRLDRRGKHTMLHRFIAGVLHELMVLIKKEESVLAGSEFAEILAEMHEDSRVSWAALVAIAVQGDAKPESMDHAIQKALVIARNTSAFHYHAMKSISDAWRFLASQPKAGPAPYSLGENTPSTRFYYADTLVQEIMISGTNRFLKPQSGAPRFDGQFLAVAYTANAALGPLVHAFLRVRDRRD